MDWISWCFLELVAMCVCGEILSVYFGDDSLCQASFRRCCRRSCISNFCYLLNSSVALPIAIASRCGKYLHRQVRGSCRVVVVIVVIVVVVVVVVVEVESC